MGLGNFVKRLFGGKPDMGLSPEQKAALDAAGAKDVAKEAGSAVGMAPAGAQKGNFCEKGHPLYHGQRQEDCFDCYLLGLMEAERSSLDQEKPETVIVGTLIALNGFHRGQAFPLVMAEGVPIIIGADPDCDIVLSDERISRRHLSMVRRQGRTTVRDLNSLHHSAMRAEGELQWYVLDPEREYWFRDGCHLMLGDIEFLFRGSDEQTLKVSEAAG